MNVLLLEKKNGKNHRPNLALARFSTLYKEVGIKVQHIMLDSKTELPKTRPDHLIISIIFSWDIPYLAAYYKLLVAKYPHLAEPGRTEIGGVAPFFTAELIEKEFGVAPHKGCNYELDHVIPDPSFYNNSECFLFSSRSCQRVCAYCCVKFLEPSFYVIENWKEQLNMKSPRVVLCDNNILTTPDHHKQDVFNYLKQIAPEKGVAVEGGRAIRRIEFDGGLDHRVIEENIELIKGIKYSKLRLAWDDVKGERVFNRGITALLKAFPQKSKRGLHENFEVFVLYNCPWTNDTIEDCLYRAYKLYHHYHVWPYLMRYQPLDTLRYKSYVSPQWDENDVIDLGRWANNRYVLPKVPRFTDYYGRKEDGSCISNCSASEIQAFETVKKRASVPIAIDYTKPFRANLSALRQELEQRAEMLQKTTEAIHEQLAWFAEAV